MDSLSRTYYFEWHARQSLLSVRGSTSMFSPRA